MIYAVTVWSDSAVDTVCLRVSPGFVDVIPESERALHECICMCVCLIQADERLCHWHVFTMHPLHLCHLLEDNLAID